MSAVASTTEIHRDLATAISSLHEEQRIVLGLFYSECLSLEQIGVVLGYGSDEIAATFYRAHQALGTLAPGGEAAVAA